MKKIIFLLALLGISSTICVAQVGIGTNTPAASAALDINSTTKGFLPPRMTILQRNAIASPSEGLLVYQTDSPTGIYIYKGGAWSIVSNGILSLTTTGTSGPSTLVGNTLNIPQYSGTGGVAHFIGENYGGGIVFNVYDDGQHGLIAATTDQSTGFQWYNGAYTVTNAVRAGITAGILNTERIITNQGAGNYAAQLCANYQGNGYGDWYLPSKQELNLLYLQKNIVGGFTSNNYWSSSEYSQNNAYMQSFSDGIQYGQIKNSIYYVRAIRAF